MLKRARKFFSREKVKKRPSDMLKFTVPGPVIVFRPAVPSWPEGGSEKAAVLKKSSVLRSERGRSTGEPVASGRSEANAPEPLLFDWFPATCAVKGEPDCTVVTPDNLPVTDDPRRDPTAVEEVALLPKRKFIGVIDD